MRLAITKPLGFVHAFSKDFWRFKRGDQWYFEAINRRETTQWLRGGGGGGGKKKKVLKQTRNVLKITKL